MKLLLDENLPKKLKYRFREAGHDAFTTPEMGWAAKRNGDLLKLMIQEGFDCLITVDSSIAHQQNFKQYPIPVLILKGKTGLYEDLIALLPKANLILNQAMAPGPHKVDFRDL